jgi:hypothetical protein
MGTPVAIRDWVHEKLTFNDKAAHTMKPSTDVLIERAGSTATFNTWPSH